MAVALRNDLVKVGNRETIIQARDNDVDQSGSGEDGPDWLFSRYIWR